MMKAAVFRLERKWLKKIGLLHRTRNVDGAAADDAISITVN